MRPSDAETVLMALGYRIDGGNVFYGRYLFGKIEADGFVPEGRDPMIPWSEIENFADSDQGSFGHYLNIIRPDGSSKKLNRYENSESKGFSKLKMSPDGSSYLMPDSISDLMDVWTEIFPTFGEQCWKENSTGLIMVDPSLIGEAGTVKSLDDVMIIRIVSYVQSKLKRLGCKGKQPRKDTIKDVLVAEAELYSRNLFLDMMRSRQWDGNQRLDRLFIDVLGGKMQDLSDEESEAVLKDVCKCWFIGAVARQHKAIQLDIIPIMIGTTGCRKSSAAKWMATCDDYFREPLDISEKRFVEDTKGGLIIELAEMKATKGKDNDYLKGIISRASDRIRLSYDRCSTDNIRRFVMIGTTNESEFLTDLTGNRRYYPFEVSPERTTVGFGKDGFRSNDAYEYILQVWAEAYHRYKAGEEWYLTKETIQMAKKAQEASVVNDPNVDILSELVDKLFPLPGDVLCKKDLVYILGSQAATYGEEAAIAAERWWGTPHIEWRRAGNVRIHQEELRGWLTQPSVSVKCKIRVKPAGSKESTNKRVLGE